MPTTTDLNTQLTGDIMHLNDVEPFPETMEEGFFRRGDVMVSLRNINTILFYNDSTKKIKNVTTGDFVRQHDPDFIDGNKISILDNFNIGSKDPGQQTRILIKSFQNNQTYVYYQGNSKSPFNTIIMGKHQWLPNGDLLITESMNGRAFELNKQKEIVWEFVNILPNNLKGLVQEVTKVPKDYVMNCFNISKEQQ